MNRLVKVHVKTRKPTDADSIRLMELARSGHRNLAKFQDHLAIRRAVDEARYATWYELDAIADAA